MASNEQILLVLVALTNQFFEYQKTICTMLIFVETIISNNFS